MPHTAGPVTVTPGSPSGTTGAGRPRQLTPRSRVRTIEVHGACWHGAVPSANASRVEAKVTEAALNPAGTGPPAKTLYNNYGVAGQFWPATGLKCGQSSDNGFDTRPISASYSWSS